MRYSDYHSIRKIISKLTGSLEELEGRERACAIRNLRRLQQHLYSDPNCEKFSAFLNMGVLPVPHFSEKHKYRTIVGPAMAKHSDEIDLSEVKV